MCEARSPMACLQRSRTSILPAAPGWLRPSNRLLVLHHTTALEGATERDLVGIFEITADREAGCEAGHAQVEVHEESRKIGLGRLTLEVRVGGDDVLGDRPIRQPLHQLTDAQIVWPDPVDRADGAAEHVVQAPELA